VKPSAESRQVRGPIVVLIMAAFVLTLILAIYCTVKAMTGPGRIEHAKPVMGR
jgi:hypothetical protein